MKVVALIPARNEAACLPRVIDELASRHPTLDVMVVDDASEDSTADLLRTLPVRYLRLTAHLGLGGALRAGLRYARHLGYDAAVRLDGDGQHPPEIIEAMLAPLREGRADAVVGSRYVDSIESKWSSPLMLRFSQAVLARLLSPLTGHRVTDPTSGLWAFGPRALFVLAEHHPTGYPEPELHLFLARNGLSVVEIPVSMRPRMAGRTHLTQPRIALALARVLLALLVTPLRSTVERMPE